MYEFIVSRVKRLLEELGVEYIGEYIWFGVLKISGRYFFSISKFHTHTLVEL